MAFNTQHKLAKIRKPRVHISYDVMMDGAPQDKELPMVVAILSDLRGETAPTEALKDRKFTRIEPHSFDKTIEKIAPSVSFSIAPKNSESIEVKLNFTSLADFSPDGFLEKSSLAPILKRRQLLKDMVAKLDGNDKLLSILTELIKQNKIKELILPTAAPASATTPANEEGGKS